MTCWKPGAITLALLGLLVAGCAAPAETPEPPSRTSGASSPVASSSPEQGRTPATAPSETAGGDDPGYATDDLGSGTVRIGETEYAGFDGQCEFSKGFGSEPVDDPDGDGVLLVLGIDNAESGVQPQLGLSATGTSGFRLLGHSAKRGKFTAMEFAGSRTVMDHVDIALVTFTGTTEDDDPLVADLVCLVQKP